MTEAVKAAIEQTGLNQRPIDRPSARPGEIIIPHGPPTRGETESGVVLPQERRTRDDENTPGSSNQ
jgi:hypothetical protein